MSNHFCCFSTGFKLNTILLNHNPDTPPPGFIGFLLSYLVPDIFTMELQFNEIKGQFTAVCMFSALGQIQKVVVNLQAKSEWRLSVISRNHRYSASQQFSALISEPIFNL